VLASASIPLLFPPVRVGPHLLWDGGLLVNTPLAPAVALGAEEIVAVLVTEPAEPDSGPFRHFGRAVERTVDSFLENAYNMDRKLLLERNRVTRLQGGPYREVILYDAVRPGRAAFFNAGSYLYFERGILGAMHDAGRRAAGAWLAAGPQVDHLDEPAAELAFETRSGVLRAVRAGDGGIRLDFPADPPVPIDPPAGLAAALGVAPVGVHRGVSDVLVEVADSGTVRRLTPDLRALAAIPARGVIVTAAGSGSDGDAPTDDAAGADFVSRCFYPAAGVDEDPVTGSAHCTLASFWCARLGRSSLVGWQASARGGRVGVELAGDRVLLTGRAVTVLRGDLV